MISQQPEGHDTFASGDSCFCAAKVAPVALSITTASVNWLSDKRYYCVIINPKIGPLSRTEQKSLWPQAVYRIFTHKKTSIQMDKGLISMVTQEGLEPPTLWFVVKYSNPAELLSHNVNLTINIIILSHHLYRVNTFLVNPNYSSQKWFAKLTATPFPGITKSKA